MFEFATHDNNVVVYCVYTQRYSSDGATRDLIGVLSSMDKFKECYSSRDIKEFNIVVYETQLNKSALYTGKYEKLVYGKEW
jgi:hypothetical protein